MAQGGSLSRDNFGYSMPIDAPLFPRPPIYYRNVETIRVAFLTDEDAVAAMIPADLTVASPAVATASVITYHFSTLGTYNEFMIILGVQRDGQDAYYIPHIMVDNDQALAAGREIWGYPKKLAHITLERQGQAMIGTVERPVGNRLCTVTVQPETPVEQTPPAAPGLSLRVIPGLGENGAPELAQLIETRTISQVHGAWSGPAGLSFGVVSTIDPLSRLPIRQIIGGTYVLSDMILPLGRVVKQY